MPLGNFPGLSTCRKEKEGQRFRVFITLLKTKPELLPLPARATERHWKLYHIIKMNYANSWLCHNLSFLISSFRCDYMKSQSFRNCMKNEEHHSLGLICSSLPEESLWKIHSDFSGLVIQSQWLVGQSSTDGKGNFDRFYLWGGVEHFHPPKVMERINSDLHVCHFRSSLVSLLS